MNDMTKQAEYFIASGSVPKLANYLEKITGEAAEIIKELKRERDEARAARDKLAAALAPIAEGLPREIDPQALYYPVHLAPAQARAALAALEK